MGLEGVLGHRGTLVKVFPPIWVIFGGQDRVPYKRNALYFNSPSERFIILLVHMEHCDNILQGFSVKNQDVYLAISNPRPNCLAKLLFDQGWDDLLLLEIGLGQNVPMPRGRWR